MKRKLLAVAFISFCLAALPATVLADSRTFSPPAEKGTIYIVIKFTKGLGGAAAYFKLLDKCY
jgi:hypothetical protein